MSAVCFCRNSDVECVNDSKKDPGEITDSEVPAEQRKKKKRKHKQHHKHKKDKVVDKIDTKSDKQEKYESIVCN
jgi:serine/threonine-protein kinase PRP4